jgi:hypothetical protein
MTETLNYNPTDPNAPEFSEDEQNSLEVAEKLGEEEARQYAGKFNNAEDLENAYLELQKKLGSNNDEDTEVDTLDEDEDEEVSPAVSLITEASDEYYANEGRLSQETMDKFGEMSSQDLVNAYMAIQSNAPEGQYAESADLTDAEMNTVYNSAGGEKAYQNMVTWAADNLAEKKLDAFNSIINQCNATAIQIAVAGLRSEYENAEGYEGRMLTGKAARSSRDVFRSQAEVVQAMKDPRYANDPAYQQDIFDKLERSNVEF